MVSLNDIQNTIFEVYILPYMNLNDIRSLQQVNRIWYNICNNNSVWRILYIRGLPNNKWNLIDQSIHFNSRLELEVIKNGIHFKRDVNRWNYNTIKNIYENDGFITRLFIVDIAHPNEWLMEYMDCIPVHILIGGCYSMDFMYYMNKGFYDPTVNDIEKVEYIDSIINRWKTYNKSIGYTGRCLCMNKNHYFKEHMLPPNKVRNYKSFKKVVYNKQKTKKKKQLEKVNRKINKVNKKYKNLFNELNAVKCYRISLDKEKRQLQKEVYQLNLIN